MGSVYRTSDNAQSLTNKVAIVTGASRGIGAGIALELARRGAKVLEPANNSQIDLCYCRTLR